MLLRDEDRALLWWPLNLRIPVSLTMLLMICLVLPLPALAQSNDQAGSSDFIIWQSFDLLEVDNLLRGMELPKESGSSAGTEPYSVYKSAKGYNFFVQPRLCGDDSGCLGLNIVSLFDLRLTRDQLSYLNDQYSFMKFYESNDGELILQKYIIADYGIARGNVRITVETFIDILEGFEDKISD